MNNEIGTRVIAIRDAGDGVVNSFGEGVYEGDFHLGDVVSTTPFTEQDKMKLVAQFLDGDLDEAIMPPNPRIRLDDGTCVWGTQCWWGPKDVLLDRFKDYDWNTVPVDPVIIIGGEVE